MAVLGTMLLGGLAACSGPAQPQQVTVPLAKLQEALQRRFPKTLPVAGLLQFELLAPQLQLQPESNQLRCLLPVQLAGPALKQAYTGHMDVHFALRYEAQDRTVRAHQVVVNALAIDGVPDALGDMLATYGTRLAAQALEQQPLYQLEDKHVQMAVERGLELAGISVAADGLVLQLNPKPVPTEGR